jgi:hypothetical protein
VGDKDVGRNSKSRSPPDGKGEDDGNDVDLDVYNGTKRGADQRWIDRSASL